MLSFAGNLTFANAPGLREAAAVVPPELLLVETDAPFLTPVPNRGKLNAPALVGAHAARPGRGPGRRWPPRCARSSRATRSGSSAPW